MAALFDANQRIKIVPAPAPPSIPVTVAPGMSAAPNVTEMLMLHILQQAQTQSALLHSQQFTLPATSIQNPLLEANTQPAPLLPGLSAPPSPTKHYQRVSLDEFFIFYEIEEVDRDRLAKIDFRPGDAISKLPEAEWRGVGGFSTLAWERMLNISCHFS